MGQIYGSPHSKNVISQIHQVKNSDQLQFFTFKSIVGNGWMFYMPPNTNSIATCMM